MDNTTPAQTKPVAPRKPCNVTHAVFAAICMTGVATAFANQSYVAFGMISVVSTMMSCFIHIAYAFHRDVSPVIRLCTISLAVGIALIMHTVLRAIYTDSYLDYIGGYRSRGHVAYIIEVGVCNAFAPVLAVTYAPRTPVAMQNVYYTIIGVVAGTALFHEGVTIAPPSDRSIDTASKTMVLVVCSTLSACAAALISDAVITEYSRYTEARAPEIR